jgi:UDP-N-acetylglucosamine diphosphorylase/glucosamine-1-phosphate N-acetyltransferase
MKYVIFDDLRRENFFPLTLNRSTGDLRAGILKLRQKISAYLELEYDNLIISDELADLYQERHPDWQINSLKDGDTVFVNSRCKISEELAAEIRELETGHSLTSGTDILAARVDFIANKISSETLGEIFRDLKKKKSSSGLFWENIWQIITENPLSIERDFQDFFYDKDNYYETELGVTILNPYNVWIGDKTVISPGVVIDASKGPVVVDEEVTIMPNSVIMGPAFIGKGSVIKSGARIYEGSSIGPLCKIGGEVESTIFQGYSNKQHEGFLGHSYIGEWVNLGADTNNSDLKNNYKNVRVYYYPEKERVDTGYTFMGSILGDHVKTAINSTLNTGTVIGLGSNLIGNDLISGFIPSLKWGRAADLMDYRIEKFLETAELVKARRGLQLTEVEKALLSSFNDLE